MKEFKLEEQFWMTKIRKSSAGGYFFSLNETRKSRKKMNDGRSERNKAPMSHYGAQDLLVLAIATFYFFLIKIHIVLADTDLLTSVGGILLVSFCFVFRF